ncbi:MAG: peptide chain release factor N(5)-glutamine methyltransferase [Dehalococcoidia bacterium]|nr:MAG: peptide chain release factor N(5)-glutamine methyltransferase [Dehalococcoidia bacterium]
MTASVTGGRSVRELLREATQRLQVAHAADDIDEARLQAELLYGLATGLDRAQVIAAGNDAAAPAAIEAFEALIERRVQHEPFAYILGKREFFGMTFEVGPGCLVPRPETETLVEAALEAIKAHPEARRLVRVADIGTGSGAIALSVARHAPNTTVYAVDVSTAALQWAGKNMRRFDLQDRVVLLAGDLAEPLTEPIDVLLANLPYVPTDEFEALPAQIREREPRLAVEGGPDGVELIARLAQQLDAHLASVAAAIFEVGAGQISWVEELVTRALTEAGRTGLDVRFHRDLRGIRRVLEVRMGYPKED